MWSEEPSREDEVNSAGTQVLKSLQTVPSARKNQNRVDRPARVSNSGLVGSGGGLEGKEGFSEQVTFTLCSKGRKQKKKLWGRE